jgi:hypothetical protein
LTKYVATIGGKTRGPPASRFIGKPLESLPHEPFAPLAYDAPSEPNLPADLGERGAIRDHQDRLRTNDIPVRRRHCSSYLFQDDALRGLQHDLDRGLATFALHPTRSITSGSSDPVFCRSPTYGGLY